MLVIDDEADLLQACRIGLTAFGHSVVTAETGAGGIASAGATTPDVIVLDMGLPDMDGLEVCSAIRAGSDVPILVLSADGTEARKVEALDLGADDYLTKPIGMRELDARIRASQRFPRGQGRPAELDVGTLHFDLTHRSVSRAGVPLDLTRKEFDFLALLAAHTGKSCSRHMILDAVWGPGYRTESQYLKVYAYRLRKKLGDDQGEILRSDPPVGYRLLPPTS